MDFKDLSDFVTTSKGVVDLFKAAYGLLPQGQDRKDIERQVQMAENLLQRNDAKLAKELGFHLCDCTWPPQIMLWRESEKVRVCQRAECGRRIEMQIQQDRQPPSWEDFRR
jgi:uncharacterized protein HemY